VLVVGLLLSDRVLILISDILDALERTHILIPEF